MSSRTHPSRAVALMGALLLVAGITAIVIAVRAQRSAPQPPAAAATAVSITPSAPRPSTSAPSGAAPGPKTSGPAATPSAPTGPVLARSVPTRLQIPAIEVDSSLKDIGLTSTGEIATPPLVRDSHAYWLTVSPTPGQLGPATIIGHVDSAAYGPGVFFKLGALRQHDKIYVTRADGIVATFEIERVAEYKKAAFPTQEVYGNIDHAGLRLITCGGTFDSSQRSYESNIVVYATLVSSRRV